MRCAATGLLGGGAIIKEFYSPNCNYTPDRDEEENIRYLLHPAPSKHSHQSHEGANFLKILPNNRLFLSLSGLLQLASKIKTDKNPLVFCAGFHSHMLEGPMNPGAALTVKSCSKY